MLSVLLHFEGRSTVIVFDFREKVLTNLAVAYVGNLASLQLDIKLSPLYFVNPVIVVLPVNCKTLLHEDSMRLLLLEMKVSLHRGVLVAL